MIPKIYYLNMLDLQIFETGTSLRVNYKLFPNLTLRIVANEKDIEEH